MISNTGRLLSCHGKVSVCRMHLYVCAMVGKKVTDPDKQYLSLQKVPANGPI